MAIRSNVSTNFFSQNMSVWIVMKWQSCNTTIYIFEVDLGCYYTPVCTHFKSQGFSSSNQISSQNVSFWMSLLGEMSLPYVCKIAAHNILITVSQCLWHLVLFPVPLASWFSILLFPTKSLTFPHPQLHSHGLFIPMSKPFAFILIGLEYDSWHVPER